MRKLPKPRCAGNPSENSDWLLLDRIATDPGLVNRMRALAWTAGATTTAAAVAAGAL
jgi:hypothetical protein